MVNWRISVSLYRLVRRYGLVQVVWRNTQLVGCGSAKCPGGGTFVVCSYYPPGNYNGQRPWLQSDSLTSTPVQGSREEA